MINTTIFILCAGEAARWNNHLDVPKQLIPIGGEPLLERTVRLLHAKNIFDINIIAHDELLKIKTCNFIRPSKYQWIAETLLSTQSLWNENTIILLGDVFYTKEAINTIVRTKKNIHVYGRYGANKYIRNSWGEIFSLSFERGHWNEIITNATKVIRHAKSGGRGKLWELYRSLACFSLDEHLIEKKIFISIHDLTDDFDYPSDYDNNVKRYEYLTSTDKNKKIWICIFFKYSEFRELIYNLRRTLIRCIDLIEPLGVFLRKNKALLRRVMIEAKSIIH